jgi:hypothetical protein
MNGSLTLEKKSLSVKITFQKCYPQYIREIRSNMDAQKAPKFNFLAPSKNDIFNTLERLKAYGCTKSTKVQLEEMPHKQYIFLIKGIQLLQMFGN